MPVPVPATTPRLLAELAALRAFAAAVRAISAVGAPTPTKGALRAALAALTTQGGPP